MLLQIDGTFLFVLLSFIIFIGLMNLICYKPVMKVIAQREKFYEKNKKTVIETNSKKESVEQQINNEILKTKIESSKMVQMAADDNKNKKENIIYLKKEENKTQINEFENSLNNSSIQVKQELKNEIETYVKDVVSKILKQNPQDIKIDKQKIDEILK